VQLIRRLSLASRLALLFAACTAVVSLLAGVLFNRASEAHFLELDQQLLDSKLMVVGVGETGVQQSILNNELECSVPVFVHH